MSCDENTDGDNNRPPIKQRLTASAPQLVLPLFKSSSFKMSMTVDTKQNKVVGAVVGKDAVDTILSFLTLPLSAVTHLVPSGFEPEHSSLQNIYESLQVLATMYKQSKDLKSLLLKSSGNLFDLLNLFPSDSDDDSKEALLDIREEEKIIKETYYSRACLFCGVGEKKKSEFSRFFTVVRDEPDEHVGYVHKRPTYFISDDMTIRQFDVSLYIDSMNAAKIEKLTDLKRIEVICGQEEVLKLLKESLETKTVLTSALWQNLKVEEDITTRSIEE